MSKTSNPPKWEPTDRTTFENVLNNRTLIVYYNDLRLWHGYVRFLGLPHLRDTPDVNIRQLYVEPLFAEQHIHHDEDPDNWPETVPLLEMLVNKPRLVLLGDPGSGKSTLVNWIVMQFIRPEGRRWQEQLGQLVPIPLILRDLNNLGRDLTWDRLKEAFLAQSKFSKLRDNDVLESVMARGQAMILLDGLDEIGDEKRRVALRNAVAEGIKRYPKCRWLVTSRIVGYDEVPFNLGAPENNEDSSTALVAENVTLDASPVPRGILRIISGKHRPGSEHIRYLAPFNDKQIEQFSSAWYHRHETNREEVSVKARNLVHAIQANQGTLHLARIPNLLTMMALIHRTRADLPQGRVFLYDDIAEAYLKSIDDYRGIVGSSYNFSEKFRWLARVGLEMQMQRTAGKQDTEILTTGETILGWVADEMSKMTLKTEDTEREAREFVDYIKRRSGLLLPRGENLFAFMHLSFQEYFAACALQERLCVPMGLPKRSQNGELTQKDLQQFALSPAWRETFIFLFERFATRDSWPDHLTDLVFGEQFKRIFQKNVADHLFHLLANIAINPYSGLTATKREAAFTACWQWDAVFREQKPLGKGQMRTAPSLLIIEPYAELAKATLVKLNAEQPISELHLRGNNSIENLLFLRGFKLEKLWLVPNNLPNLAGIESMDTLTILFIDSDNLADLQVLQALGSLNSLGLVNGLKIKDLAPLKALVALEFFYLARTGVSDLSPLLDLPSLKFLDTDVAIPPELKEQLKQKNVIIRKI